MNTNEVAPVLVPVHEYDEEICDTPDTMVGDPDCYCGHGITRIYVWA